MAASFMCFHLSTVGSQPRGLTRGKRKKGSSSNSIAEYFLIQRTIARQPEEVEGYDGSCCAHQFINSNLLAILNKAAGLPKKFVLFGRFGCYVQISQRKLSSCNYSIHNQRKRPAFMQTCTTMYYCRIRQNHSVQGLVPVGQEPLSNS
jgi:hypothetical protein